MTIKGKPLLPAALRRKILSKCRPEEREGIEFMLKSLRWQPSPEDERKSSLKPLGKASRQLKK